MLQATLAGVYAIRSANAQGTAQAMVQSWLRQDALWTDIRGCLWMTASPQSHVRQFLQPYLQRRAAAPKGLDVVSVRHLWSRGGGEDGVQQLCRSLHGLVVLKPGLVILEHPSLWFDHGQAALSELNPLFQMRLMQRWARYANCRVLLCIEGEIPHWCAFADGLAELDERGEPEFLPWWPSASETLKSALWNPSEPAEDLPSLQVRERDCGSLQQLGHTVHSARFNAHHALRIVVYLNNPETLADASVLLRLGADEVRLVQTVSPSEDAAATLVTPALVDDAQGLLFSRDLHEIFMPGQLSLLSNHAFARLGLMMLEVATHWGMQCTITRLSLQGHVTAQTAMKLVNFGDAACMFTATREAIYLMKLWSHKPTDGSLDEWLAQCFRERIPVIASGHVHVQDNDSQADLLMDLEGELEPIAPEVLMTDPLHAPAQLAEVWFDPEAIGHQRPWGQRLQGWSQKQVNA
ncbi:hypothetical protein NQT62_03065 [Limnobacter humi]|uniref:Cellulose biosynthesis protein BcsE n=1 Tax=Limnobacter humi TaxID=1778671 RepID=A0ABT1WEV8_9BURK|nr:hypothetical protein [Limnobacter humi]MCQ8895418.1 hypothetical protein [Limnobacter humi]